MAMNKATITDVASLLVEKFSPIALSLIGGVLIYNFKNDICHMVTIQSLNLSNLYNAVLSWASIQIGFAFGAYGFILGKTQGFIESIRDTVAMQRLLVYVKRATHGGFLLTFTSIPLSVATPMPTTADSLKFHLIAAWFVLFLWTFFAFLRVAFNFGHITAVRDRQPFHGA